MIAESAMLDIELEFCATLTATLPGIVLEPVCTAAATLAARPQPIRQERLSGIHNPWGGAATLTDPWAFLDLCEHAELVDAVSSIVGPNVILWDSELYLRAKDYIDFVNAGREGRYWPLESLAGAVALVPLTAAGTSYISDVRQVSVNAFAQALPRAPLYVIRYMPAVKLFRRDARLLANRLGMEEQPLINYTTRPLWLVRGEDRGGNDFVTGFSASVPYWTER